MTIVFQTWNDHLMIVYLEYDARRYLLEKQLPPVWAGMCEVRAKIPRNELSSCHFHLIQLLRITVLFLKDVYDQGGIAETSVVFFKNLLFSHTYSHPEASQHNHYLIYWPPLEQSQSPLPLLKRCSFNPCADLPLFYLLTGLWVVGPSKL